MKLSRLVGLCGVALALIAPAAQAQGGGGGGRGGGRGMAAMMANITLTADQQTKVDSIVAKYRAMGPQMQRGTPMDSAARAQMMENNNKRNAEIRGVLTAEQQKVFDENLKKAMAA